MPNESLYFASVFAGFGYTILGIPTSACNFLITVAILKYSALRDQKELIVLMGLAFTDAIHSLGFAAAGIYRLHTLLTGQADSQVTTVHCLSLPHMWLWAIGGPTSTIMLIIVSTDRLLLIALRGKYIFGLGLRYAWCMILIPCGFCVLFSLVALIAALLRSEESPLLGALCYSPDAYYSDTHIGHLYVYFYKQTQTKFNLLSVLLFVAIYPVYKHQQAKVIPTSDEQLKIQMKRQQRLTKNIAVSSFCTLIFACIPTELGYVFWYDYQWYFLGYFCWLLFLLNPLANLFIYQLGQKDMRTAINGLIACKQLPQNIDLWPS